MEIFKAEFWIKGNVATEVFLLPKIWNNNNTDIQDWSVYDNKKPSAYSIILLEWYKLLYDASAQKLYIDKWTIYIIIEYRWDLW